jgi:hypothetical protein
MNGNAACITNCRVVRAKGKRERWRERERAAAAARRGLRGTPIRRDANPNNNNAAGKEEQQRSRWLVEELIVGMKILGNT